PTARSPGGTTSTSPTCLSAPNTTCRVRTSASRAESACSRSRATWTRPTCGSNSARRSLPSARRRRRRGAAASASSAFRACSETGEGRRVSINTFGRVFRVTTWGESHGPALGAIVDGCPPGVALTEDIIQPWLDRRRPGQSRYTTQRREADAVEILSGVFEGRTTGAPISLLIHNTDQRSKDYGDI